MRKSFHSNGKLLLTGEYVVLNGATALAIPTKQGQSLEIETSIKSGIHWESFDENNNVWFEGNFGKTDEQISSQSSSDLIRNQLLKILQEAKKLNPEFLENSKGFNIKTELDFPRKWGLGTSSTLINNIAQWANVDAFALLAKSFGGSGYDIAAAQNDFPILYELKNMDQKINRVDLEWKFTENLFFVYLNQKQDSKEGIAHYRQNKLDKGSIEKISDISKTIISCDSLFNFEILMNAHEEIISKLLRLPTVKSELFSDFPNTIKSLGAWGGDFVLATGNSADMDYFRKRGFDTVIPFEEMIK